MSLDADTWVSKRFAQILLAAALSPLGALAQTTVGGAITADTTWSVADSPYVVTSDVTVQGNAVLTIEAGTAVYMGAGITLTVEAGGLRALGTAQNLIRVSSDAVRLGQAGAPGQWDNWIFNAGAVDSKLEHVVIEYGKGLAVNGAAPVFNDLTIRNHQGAAITVDLAASPTGVGNQASGNTLNAIVVPSGDITGTVTWGLRGIPYLVQTGQVSVGASPAINSISPPTIEQGETVTVTLDGTRLAGPASAKFNTAGLSAQALSGGTATQVPLSVTAAADAALGPTPMLLLVDAGEIRVPNALSVIRPQPHVTSLSPASLDTGQGTISLEVTGRNFNNSAEVLVNETPVTTTYVSATELTADIPNQTSAGTLAITARIPDPDHNGQYLVSAPVNLPVVPAPAFSISPASLTVATGRSANITITSNRTAGTEGLTVSLSSSDTSIATVPASVTIPSGATSTPVTVTGGSSLGSATISAQASGFETGTGTVTTRALSLGLPAISTLSAGQSANVGLTLSDPAPQGGLVVTLGSSNTSVFTVPASITVAAGQSTADVAVTGVNIGSATLTATAVGYQQATGSITVTAASVHWVGATGGNWNTASNWSGGAVPGATADVYIGLPADQTVTISSGTVTVHALTSDCNLTISAATLNLNDTSQINGNLTLSNGILGGTGNVTVIGAFNVGGTAASAVAGTGTLTTQGTSQIDIGGGQQVLQFAGGRTWVNQGTLTIGGDDRIWFGYTSGGSNTLINAAGATINLSSIIGTPLMHYSGPASFTNNGTVNHTVSGTHSIDGAIAFNNTGTVNVTAGTLSYGTNFTNQGTLSVASGASMSITGSFTNNAGGTVRVGLANATTFGVVAATGTASLNGTLAVYLTGGFIPAGTEIFNVMTYASKSGAFTAQTGESPDGQVSYTIDTTSEATKLKVRNVNVSAP